MSLLRDVYLREVEHGDVDEDLQPLSVFRVGNRWRRGRGLPVSLRERYDPAVNLVSPVGAVAHVVAPLNVTNIWVFLSVGQR